MWISAILALGTTVFGSVGETAFSGAGSTQFYIAPEYRFDAVAVWDMQTLDGGDVANIVPGATEYNLVFAGTSPTITAEGLSFPTATGINQGVAAGTGTDSITSAATIYVAFKWTGASTFGTATLIESSLATISPLNPEVSPILQSPDVNSSYTMDRWNDGEEHILCAIIEPTRLRLYVDGNPTVDKSEATTFPITLSSFAVGDLVTVFEGRVYYAGVFNTAHDNSTRNLLTGQIRDIAFSRGVTIEEADGFVVFEGDSITESNYVVGLLSQYTYLSVADLTPIARGMNMAFHGDELADAEGRAAAVDAMFAASPAAHKVLSVFIGGNDVQAGTAPATVYAALIAYCTARKAATTGLKIIVCTSPVRDVVGFEANRLTWNALLMGGDSSYDAVADFGSDEFLGDPAQADIGGATTYFADGIHPNATGHAIMGPIHQAVLAPLLEIIP